MTELTFAPASDCKEETAKNGQPIFTVAGVHLCSSYDPEREARSWLRAYHEKCRPAETVFLIGLGCGYRAIALAEDFREKKVIVFEKNDDFIRWFRRNSKQD